MVLLKSNIVWAFALCCAFIKARQLVFQISLQTCFLKESGNQW